MLSTGERMERLARERADGHGALDAAAAIAVSALLALALTACGSEEPPSWGSSAEFSTLPSGQERFSVHDTNLAGWSVVVDHRSGVQYLVNDVKDAACPLLSADGSPMLVDEAGE